jgi:hypothetical protein
MSLALINGALVTAYQAVSLGLSTAYEGKDFKPAAGTAWAAVFNLPASTVVDTLGAGGQDVHDGVFQIDINVPENLGTAVLLQHAQSLRAYFYAGRTVSYSGQDVRIRGASRGAIRREGAWLRLSVSVSYWAWTARP